jgi:hypothetical protein
MGVWRGYTNQIDNFGALVLTANAPRHRTVVLFQALKIGST